MHIVVIVESAAKAKTIAKYLQNKTDNVTVIACFGHVVDLPKGNTGVDVATWKASYEPIPGKSQIIRKLRDAVNKADVVYLASDPDMEGEAIAYHLKNVLKLTKPMRITFNEITPTAIKNAIQHPKEIDMDIVNAQEARRILDRVVGYELSPLLWKQFDTRGLSAGRVQSAALKIIVDKAHAVETHEPSKYWDISGVFSDGKTAIDTKAYVRTTNDVAVWTSEIDAEKNVRFIASQRKKVWNSVATSREVKRNPSPPFVTSTLQQEAYNKLRLSTKRTMQIAQTLYESGYITYMRTDSSYISSSAQQQITSYISDTYGSSYVMPRQYKVNNPHAQQAHECIRPTKVNILSDALINLDDIHKKLYDLVWKRAVASQMTSAIYLETQTRITCDTVEQEFRGKHETLIYEGFMKLYDACASPKTQTSLNQSAVVTPISIVATGNVTQPPSLLNEPSLVRTLEKEGIGRPSTYASIIDKIVERGYVEKTQSPYTKKINIKSFSWNRDTNSIATTETQISCGTVDKDKFLPTDLGKNVVHYISSIVPELVDKTFTSVMEAHLDEIADRKSTKVDVLTNFYQSFHGALSTASKKIQKQQPSRVQPNKIKDFPHLKAKVIKTRYGIALFNDTSKKYISLDPFLKWRNISTPQELTEHDVAWLLKMPIGFDTTTREIHIGKYGLYIKDGASNIKLPPKLWDAAYNGTLSPDEVINVPTYQKSRA